MEAAMEIFCGREGRCCRRPVQQDLPLRRETRTCPSYLRFPDRRYRSLVQMPVRRTHLAGIGYPFRRRPVGIEEAIFASAGLGKHRRPSTSGWV